VRFDAIISNCAQIVPKIYQKYQKTSKNIEKNRKRKRLANALFTGEVLYFLRILFRCSRLHTVEVTGSNPVSSTTFLHRKAIG